MINKALRLTTLPLRGAAKFIKKKWVDPISGHSLLLENKSKQMRNNRKRARSRSLISRYRKKQKRSGSAYRSTNRRRASGGVSLAVKGVKGRKFKGIRPKRRRRPMGLKKRMKRKIVAISGQGLMRSHAQKFHDRKTHSFGEIGIGTRKFHTERLFEHTFNSATIAGTANSVSIDIGLQTMQRYAASVNNSSVGSVYKQGALLGHYVSVADTADPSDATDIYGIRKIKLFKPQLHMKMRNNSIVSVKVKMYCYQAKQDIFCSTSSATYDVMPTAYLDPGDIFYKTYVGWSYNVANAPLYRYGGSVRVDDNDGPTNAEKLANPMMGLQNAARLRGLMNQNWKLLRYHSEVMLPGSEYTMTLKDRARTFDTLALYWSHSKATYGMYCMKGDRICVIVCEGMLSHDAGTTSIVGNTGLANPGGLDMDMRRTWSAYVDPEAGKNFQHYTQRPLTAGAVVPITDDYFIQDAMNIEA